MTADSLSSRAGRPSSAARRLGAITVLASLGSTGWGCGSPPEPNAPPGATAASAPTGADDSGASSSTQDLLRQLAAAERGRGPGDGGAASSSSEGVADPESMGDFDTSRWMKEQGVRRWPADRSCWRESTADGKPRNTCICRGTMTVATRQVLVCQSPHEQGHDGPVPFVTHTVLYEARKGQLRVVLDVPTSAAVTGCKADRVAPCWMNLNVTPAAMALVVDDGSTRGCDDVLTELDELVQYGETGLTELRSVYRIICEGRGRYGWQAGKLVRDPGSLGVRTLGH